MNNNFKKNTLQEAQEKFYIIGNSKPTSFLKKLRDSAEIKVFSELL